MRRLLDQGLPRSAAGLLAAAGHDVVHVADVGMATADDPAIITFASGEQRAVITRDADFHAWLATAQASKPSVVRVRVEGLDGPRLARLLIPILEHCRDDLERGAVISIGARSYRVRRLPLR